MTKTKATTGVSDLEVRKRIAKTEPEFKSGIKDAKKSALAPVKAGATSSSTIDLLTNRKSRLLNKTAEINEYATINGE
jgi:hypothetical protein